MAYVRQSVKRVGWRKWIDDHPAPNGWKSTEFDILAEANAPVTLFMRIWKKNRATIEKYLADRKKQDAPSQADKHTQDI